MLVAEEGVAMAGTRRWLAGHLVRRSLVLVAVLVTLVVGCSGEDDSGPPETLDDGTLTVAGLLAEEPGGQVTVSGQFWQGPDPGSATAETPVRFCQAVRTADVPDVPFFECRPPTVAASTWITSLQLGWRSPDGGTRSSYSAPVQATGTLTDEGFAVDEVVDGGRVFVRPEDASGL